MLQHAFLKNKANTILRARKLTIIPKNHLLSIPFLIFLIVLRTFKNRFHVISLVALPCAFSISWKLTLELDSSIW